MSSKMTVAKNVTGANATEAQNLAITYRFPGDLKPWPDNPRIRNEKQMVPLMASITKLGFQNPIITDEEGTILAGHGRH